MCKGKATPGKPELPKKPKRPRHTQDAVVNATRDAEWKQQLVAWEVLRAKHQDAMRQREADRKQRQSSSTAIVSTVASSSCAIVDSSANRAPTTGAAALSASDVSKKADSQLADPQLTHTQKCSSGGAFS